MVVYFLKDKYNNNFKEENFKIRQKKWDSSSLFSVFTPLKEKKWRSTTTTNAKVMLLHTNACEVIEHAQYEKKLCVSSRKVMHELIVPQSKLKLS